MPDLPPSAPPSERKKQIVAAKNLLFGTGYFLILSLPEGWGIIRSYLEPDVHSTVTRGRMTWVEAGQADQIVFNRHRRIALDFMIQIKRGKHDTLDLKGVQVSSQGSGIVGGHPASYCFGEVKQGFIKKEILQDPSPLLLLPGAAAHPLFALHRKMRGVGSAGNFRLPCQPGMPLKTSFRFQVAGLRSQPPCGFPAADLYS